MTNSEQESRKKYLTNTEKSVYNLTWEKDGVAQEYYKQSRSKRQTISPTRIHTYKPRPRPQRRSKDDDSKVDDEQIKTPEPVAYYYPYAYPPMLVYEPPASVKVVQPQRTNRTITKNWVKPNENSSHLKIEHHFVDSPNEAQKVIEDLRQKGYIDIAHHVLTSYKE